MQSAFINSNIFKIWQNLWNITYFPIKYISLNKFNCTTLFLLIQFSYIRIRFGTNCLNREISKIRRKTGRFFSPVVSCHESFVEVLIATLIKYSGKDSFQGVKVRVFNGLQLVPLKEKVFFIDSFNIFSTEEIRSKQEIFKISFKRLYHLNSV